jgi:hypothetical protein
VVDQLPIRNPKDPLWDHPEWLCGLGEERALEVYGGEGRGKLGRRFALQLRTQAALNRNLNSVLDWAGDELALRRANGWLDLLPELRRFLRSFFDESSDYGAWVSIEGWRVLLGKRLPQLRQSEGIIDARHPPSRGGRIVLQSFDRRLYLARELFLGPEKRLHAADPLVNLGVDRCLVDPVTGSRVFHCGSWWTAAEPADHGSLLRSGQIPVTRMFYENGTVMTHLISFLRLANRNELENFTLELHPDDGRLISARLSLSGLAMHLMMQPNDHDLLNQAISSTRPPEY